jgi:hypothetical protein
MPGCRAAREQSGKRRVDGVRSTNHPGLLSRSRGRGSGDPDPGRARCARRARCSQVGPTPGRARRGAHPLRAGNRAHCSQVGPTRGGRDARAPRSAPPRGGRDARAPRSAPPRGGRDGAHIRYAQVTGHTAPRSAPPRGGRDARAPRWKAADGIEPSCAAFAEPCLTTWLRRRRVVRSYHSRAHGSSSISRELRGLSRPPPSAAAARAAAGLPGLPEG